MSNIGDHEVDEAKTFVSQHLFFSHLMSFEQKHTLSQLNKETRANLMNKGIKYEAIERRYNAAN